MDSNKLLELIQAGDFAKIKDSFVSERPTFKVEHEVALKQYNVPDHDVFSEEVRPQKSIKKDSGQVNEAGQPILQTTLVDVARVGIPFQKIIVDRRVGFMLSDPVTVKVSNGEDNDAEKALVSSITNIMDDNKMDYKNKEIARRLMYEMEVAEIWYFVPNTTPGAESKFTLKVKVISPELGDTLYPLFDVTGDMIAFARGYKVKADGKEAEHFDIYTAEYQYNWVQAEGGTYTLDPLQSPNPIPNQVKKIMAVYYSQKQPEWADVQTQIDRYETNISNHADVNDYFGSPILTIIGELMGYAQKGETGKILQLREGSQANYLALATEPMSIKMEQDNLERFIYSNSQTPQISFENMKGIGNISGIALKLLFLDAHMAVKTKEETFGMGLQRRINLIKAAIGAVIDTKQAKNAELLRIKPVITPYLPMNTTEEIDNLVSALNGNIMSKETAVENNPLVSDVETEMARIQEDQDNAVALMGGGDGFQQSAGSEKQNTENSKQQSKTK